MKKHYWVIAIAFVSVIFFFYGEKIKDVLSPIIGALILTYIAYPFVEALSKRMPKILAALLFYLLILGFIALLIYFILPSTASGIRNIISKLPAIEKNLSEKLPFFSFSGGALMDFLKGKADSIQSFLSKTFSFFVSASFSIILSCFFLSDVKNLKEGFTSFIPSALKEKLTPTVREINSIFKSFFVGQVFVSLILSTLTFILLLLLKVESALVLALIYGLFCLIPAIGPFLGGIPIVAVAYLKSPTTALLAFLGIILTQILENAVISPKIKGDSVDITPASAFISIYLGSSFFGFFGIIFGVPIFASVKIILRRLFALIT